VADALRSLTGLVVNVLVKCTDAAGALTYTVTLMDSGDMAPLVIDTSLLSNFGGVLTVTAAEDVTKGGLFFFDDAQFCLTRLVEKPNASQLETLRAEGWICPGKPVWYNAGIYLFKPSLFAYTARLEKSPRGEYELTDALSAMVAESRLLAGLQIAGRWVDVRDPEVLASLQA
jgi:dTDP-glucose pyrophosphorylase